MENPCPRDHHMDKAYPLYFSILRKNEGNVLPLGSEKGGWGMAVNLFFIFLLFIGTLLTIGCCLLGGLLVVTACLALPLILVLFITYLLSSLAFNLFSSTGSKIKQMVSPTTESPQRFGFCLTLTCLDDNYVISFVFFFHQGPRSTGLQEIPALMVQLSCRPASPSRTRSWRRPSCAELRWRIQRRDWAAGADSEHSPIYNLSI